MWAKGYIEKRSDKVAIIDIDNTCVSANERLEGCTKNDEID